MSTSWEMDCYGGHGTAAAFVVEINVYVDGRLVATRTNTQVEGQEVPWDFSVPLDLDGTHTVRVTDVAANGPTEYDVFTTSMVCDVATTTTSPTTTVPPTTAAPATAATVPTTASVTAASIPPTVSVAVASTLETATSQPAPTTANVLSETITAAPATLPATGAATGPMVDLGLGFLAAGVVAVMAARRRVRFP